MPLDRTRKSATLETDMSDTPETDAAAKAEIGMSSIAQGWYVHADFARLLERERDEARKQCLQAENELSLEMAEHEATHQQRDQWRACAERLAAAIKFSGQHWRCNAGECGICNALAAFERLSQPWICDECGTAHALPGLICMKSGCAGEKKHKILP